MPESKAKDLTKEAPRSAFERINGFSILARTIDKCRADVAGTTGEYHFNCPVDRMLFDFKDIDADAFRTYVVEGRNDEEIGVWVKNQGTSKTDAEIEAWSNTVDHTMYVNNSDQGKREWFAGECQRLGLDPVETSLFKYLDVDDKASFGGSSVCPI